MCGGAMPRLAMPGFTLELWGDWLELTVSEIGQWTPDGPSYTDAVKRFGGPIHRQNPPLEVDGQN